MIVFIRVDADGTVGEIHVDSSSGFSLLDQEAVRTVKRWKFQPALRDGAGVAADLLVPVRFTLRSS